jgi:hypothetical protein
MTDTTAAGNTPPADASAGPEGATGDSAIAARIGGLPILKGLVLYAATLTFAGFYAYFIDRIATASSGAKPHLDPVMISVAAALAGVLGSAFALVIGTPPASTNEDLAKQLKMVRAGTLTGRGATRKKVRVRIRQILSLEPAGVPGQRNEYSWPLTFGIWAYAVVASAVAITYFLNQGETPSEIKALAVAFAGYVLAFFTAAFGVASKTG